MEQFHGVIAELYSCLQCIVAVGRLRKIVVRIGNMDTQDVFWRPVDPSFAPRYYHIIKEPMWFQKIIDKIELFQY